MSGISSYSAAKTAEAAAIAGRLGTPLVIHQPSYSLLNRWIEGGLTTELANAGMGAIAFTALGQGLLTDRYLQQPAADIDRATARPTFDDDLVTEEVRDRLRGLAGIAKRRGQSLAQLALAWVLRDPTRRLDTRRSVERRSARREPRRAGESRLHDRRTQRNRPVRIGFRHRPVARELRRVANAAARTNKAPSCDVYQAGCAARRAG